MSSGFLKGEKTVILYTGKCKICPCKNSTMTLIGLFNLDSNQKITFQPEIDCMVLTFKNNLAQCVAQGHPGIFAESMNE